MWQNKHSPSSSPQAAARLACHRPGTSGLQAPYLAHPHRMTWQTRTKINLLKTKAQTSDVTYLQLSANAKSWKPLLKSFLIGDFWVLRWSASPRAPGYPSPASTRTTAAKMKCSRTCSTALCCRLMAIPLSYPIPPRQTPCPVSWMSTCTSCMNACPTRTCKPCSGFWWQKVAACRIWPITGANSSWARTTPPIRRFLNWASSEVSSAPTSVPPTTSWPPLPPWCGWWFCWFWDHRTRPCPLKKYTSCTSACW